VLANISLGGANTLLTVITSGTYRVWWMISTTGDSCTLTVTVNGIAQPTLAFGLGGGSAKQIAGEGIVSLAAGDVLTLRNVSGVTCSISPNGNGGGGNAAAMTLIRLQ